MFADQAFRSCDHSFMLWSQLINSVSILSLNHDTVSWGMSNHYDPSMWIILLPCHRVENRIRSSQVILRDVSGLQFFFG
jgi:hypothetical protein